MCWVVMEQLILRSKEKLKNVDRKIVVIDIKLNLLDEKDWKKQDTCRQGLRKILQNMPVEEAWSDNNN